MDRETIEIITPLDKHKILAKTYLTARESRIIESVFINKAKLTPGGADINSINGSVATEAQDKLFEQIIISVNGKTEKIIDNVLDFKKKDFDFMVNEINKITSGEQIKKKD